MASKKKTVIEKADKGMTPAKTREHLEELAMALGAQAEEMHYQAREREASAVKVATIVSVVPDDLIVEVWRQVEELKMLEDDLTTKPIIYTEEADEFEDFLLQDLTTNQGKAPGQAN